MAANNADAQASAPYQVGYGMSSNGPTTNLYTEIFRNNARDDRNATAASGAGPQGQPGTASVAPQEPPPPPAVPTAYGISSNGTTTDLYTEWFGPRTHN